MENKYKIIVLDNVELFRKNIPEPDRTKITSAISTIGSGDFESLFIKTIKSPIKELKFKNYRLLFVIKENIVYFIGGFTKKTNKTPKKEIENAENIYKIINK